MGSEQAGTVKSCKELCQPFTESGGKIEFSVTDEVKLLELVVGG